MAGDKDGSSKDDVGHLLNNNRSRLVFLAPLQQQLDASWSVDERPSKGERTRLGWRVDHYFAGMRQASREHYLSCPTTQPLCTCNTTCPLRNAMDAVQDPEQGLPLIDVVSVSDHDASANDTEQVTVSLSQTVNEQRNGTDQVGISQHNTVRSTAHGYQSTNEPPVTVSVDASHSNNGTLPYSRTDGNLVFAEAKSSERPASEMVRKPQTAQAILTRQNKLSLGQARRVGISKTERGKQQIHRPPILRLLEEKRKAQDAEGPMEESDADEDDDANRSRQSTRQTTSFGLSAAADTLASFDSIPPPPVHSFALSSLTKLANLLSSPDHYLSHLQGGQQVGDVRHFNILVLLRRVGGIELVKNWKADKGSMIERCEVVVQDGDELTLRVVLEGDCARQWAGMPTAHSESYISLYAEPLSDKTNLDLGEGQSTLHSLDRSVTDTSFNTSTNVKRTDAQLLPVQAGDVVVLNNLRLTKSDDKKRSKAWPAPPNARFSGATANTGVYAIASQGLRSSLELCWRSEPVRVQDTIMNFDPALTAFDARCRAIIELAQTWQATS